MRKLILMAAVCLLLTGQVSALEITVPEVPSGAARWMPRETEDFGQALLEILGDAAGFFRPDLKEAAGTGVGILAAVMVLALLSSLPGHKNGAAELAGVLAVAGLLLRSAHSLIVLGADTVTSLSEYGKLLLPALAGALAAQGGVSASAAIYAGTALFSAVLSGLISGILIPMLYLFLAVSIAYSALDDAMLKKFRDWMKWGVSWCLKTVLYVYTGYITVTGVVSGTTDASLLKAAKLTISGAVPVVGGILSDASEAVLVSAGTVKNAVGIYGLLAILAVWIGPFLRIGAHYLIVKALEAVCGVFGIKAVSQLVTDFSCAMGLILAMTGTVCLMLIIGTVCFMKGAGL